MGTRARNAIFIALLAWVVATAGALAREVTDSAGRTVTLPDRAERVFAAGPPASVILYALAPEALLGWTRAPSAAEKAYLAEPYRDLPELGRLAGRGDTANLEVVVKSNPDLIVDYGSLKDTYVSLADRVAAQTGIPYLLIDGRFEAMPDALRLLGAALGREEEARALVDYASATFAEADEAKALGRSPRVYMARGPEGLETALRGSLNGEIIERVGAINVAESPGQDGVVQVSPEQVIVWAPEAIITWDKRFRDAVSTDPLWANVPAVAKGEVHFSPVLPFGWIDRPPSVNRLLGIRWLVRALYPDVFPEPIAEEVKRFYTLFYHVELDDAAVAALLAGEAPK